MIDNIALNVGQAKDYTERAEKELKKAKESHKSYRKVFY